MKKEIGWYLLGKILVGISGLATIGILTRILSPEEFGIYVTLITVTLAISNICFQWICGAIGRFYRDDRSDVLRKIGALTAISGCFSIVAASVAQNLLGYDFPLVAVALAIFSLSTALHNLALQYHNSSGRPDNYLRLSVARALILSFTLATSALLTGKGYYTFLYTTLFFGACYILWVVLGYAKKNKVQSANGASYGDLLKYGVPLIAVSASTSAIDYSDRLIMARYVGPAEVGIYVASYDVTQQTIGALMNILFLVFYPKIVGSNDLSYRKRMEQDLKTLMLLLGTISVLVFMLFSREIAVIFFGGHASTFAPNAIRLVSVAITISCFKIFYVDIGLHLQKKMLRHAMVIVSMGVCSFGLNYAFLPRYGILSAPAIMILVFVLGIILSWIASEGEIQIAVGEVAKFILVSIAAYISAEIADWVIPVSGCDIFLANTLVKFIFGCGLLAVVLRGRLNVLKGVFNS